MADKEKDPAFLFYPLDWLQGTASLFPIEKGVYIDLLCHQHQDGSLPNDPERLARMVGLSVDQFATIWSTIRCKFVDRPGNRLVNLRLEKETTKRSTGSHKNAIVGRLAVLVRTAKGVPKVIVEAIKKEFNIAQYEHLSIENATDRLTEWWTDRLTIYLNNGVPIPIENENENKDRKENEERGVGEGEGEREGERRAPPWMPMPGKEQHDLELPEIKAGCARELMALAGTEATFPQVYSLWKNFKILHFTGKRFYQNEEDAYSHFINWSKTQKINGIKPNAANGKSAGTVELATKLAAKLAARGSSDS